MRDPRRIRRMLAKLAAAWERSPDLRLGQLIDNLNTWEAGDLFTIEDERMEAVIDAWLAKVTP